MKENAYIRLKIHKIIKHKLELKSRFDLHWPSDLKCQLMVSRGRSSADFIVINLRDKN